MRFIVFILLIFSLPAWSKAKLNCFSCEIKISDLSSPVSLAGGWLFTNSDNPEFKNLPYNDKDWYLLPAPGNWVGPNGEKSPFPVGWYRGKFVFDEKLIGQDVVLLLDSYISAVKVFVDGELKFDRHNGHPTQKFYAIKAIPVKFKITKKEMNIAIRVESILMRGIYQLPFSLRKFQPYDYGLYLIHFWTDNLKQFASHLMLTFGIFFLLIFYRTRQTIYLYAGLLGVVTFPYYGLTNDVYFKILPFNSILLLHYIGILGQALFSNYFSQHFYGYSKKRIVIYALIQGSLGISFLIQLVYFDHSLYQILRKVSFFSSIFIAIDSFFLLFRAYTKAPPNLELKFDYIFYGYFIYLACALHDILLALGIIDSVGLIYLGNFITACTIIWYSIELFAHTYFANKGLIEDLQQLTNSLETKVEERTKQLKESNEKVISMAHKAGMAEIATSVLHNVGNAANTLNILNSKISEILTASQVKNLRKLNKLLFEKNEQIFDEATKKNPKFKEIPAAYSMLAEDLILDHDNFSSYTDKLAKSINEIKNIIASQKAYADFGGLFEDVNVHQILNDALTANQEHLKMNDIVIKREFASTSPAHTQKNKLFHAIYNILENAVEAMQTNPSQRKNLTIRTYEDSDYVYISIKDQGLGIRAEHIEKIFSQGFTTKDNQSGYGLHSSYNAIKEAQGQLSAHSDGVGAGAEFIIRLNKLNL